MFNAHLTLASPQRVARTLTITSDRGLFLIYAWGAPIGIEQMSSPKLLSLIPMQQGSHILHLTLFCHITNAQGSSNTVLLAATTK